MDKKAVCAALRTISQGFAELADALEPEEKQKVERINASEMEFLDSTRKFFRETYDLELEDPGLATDLRQFYTYWDSKPQKSNRSWNLTIVRNPLFQKACKKLMEERGGVVDLRALARKEYAEWRKSGKKPSETVMNWLIENGHARIKDGNLVSTNED